MYACYWRLPKDPLPSALGPLTLNDPPFPLVLCVTKRDTRDRVLWRNAASPDNYTQQTRAEPVSHPNTHELHGKSPLLERRRRKEDKLSRPLEWLEQPQTLATS